MIVKAVNPKSKFLTHGKGYTVVRVSRCIYIEGHYYLINDNNQKKVLWTQTF